MNKPTLILASHEGNQLDPSTARLVGAAALLEQPSHVLVLGEAAVADQAARLQGVERVLHCFQPQINAETLARALKQVGGDYATVLGAHCMLARAALPRAAALRNAAFLADVTAITATRSFTRPMYAGSVLASVRVEGSVFLTIRASAFQPVAEGVAAAPIVALEGLQPDARSRLIGRESATSARPDLTRARVVVAGGRGLGAAEHMKLVEALADRLGGAVGASRAAVDAGFAPNSVQIGQTGKVVAPDLYIAAGISGAIQHLAGIKDAKVIVAINKDPDAPIFSLADIGLVGDLFDVLPALTAALPATT